MLSTTSTPSASPASVPANNIASSTSPPTPLDDKPENNTRKVAIAAGVSVPIGVIAIAAAALFLYMRRRNKSRARVQNDEGAFRAYEADATSNVQEVPGVWVPPELKTGDSGAAVEMDGSGRPLELGNNNEEKKTVL